jgi:hypothetical protein
MGRARSVISSVLLGLAGSVLLLSQPSALRAQAGPTVKVTAPSNGATLTNPVTVTVVTSGALIKAATDGDPNAAHLHYFIDRDPATVLKPGQPIPTGQADIIHTPDTSEALPTLSPGAHTVWVVLAHTDHTPYSPNVQDQVSFTLGGGAVAQASPPAQPGQLPQIPVSGRGGLLGPHATGSEAGGEPLGITAAMPLRGPLTDLRAVRLIVLAALAVRGRRRGARR